MKQFHSDSGPPPGRGVAALLRRCWPGAVILAACGLAVLGILAGFLRFTSKPSGDLLIVLTLTAIVFYVWVRFFSHMRLVDQAIALVLFSSLPLCGFLMLRLDGFAGDGRPVLAWRWSPTPERRFEQSRAAGPVEEVRAPKPIDVTSTTEWDSPAFRGRDRDGRARTWHLETDWDRFPPRQLWRRPIGRGWSSFAVVGDYCVTQEQRHEDEVVVCYELRTGREVWVHRDRARFAEPTGGVGPRATPAIRDGRVYALGATGILNCLDGSTGDRIWSVNILVENQVENRIFGMAGSPLVIDEMVVVSPGGRGSSLVAYDPLSGEVIWKGGDADASYSSPQAAVFESGTQILNFHADGLSGHDLHSGEELWSYPWVSHPAERNNVCQPVPLPKGVGRDADCVFISSGYDQGCALLEVIMADGAWTVRQRWRNRNLKAKFSSVVVYENHVYGFDGHILACIDLKTGERCWKGGRYGYGQLILAGSLLLIQLESGKVALVKASPTGHREVTRFAALSNRTWNHPVLAGRHLLIRNDREAACYELPGRQD